jgi:class 3 adenylate cyclase
VLPSLTSEHLREIGVVPIGHRRRLLDAIAALRTEIPVTEPPAPRASPVRADAERRQLTVMFCDLVGSTALSSRLDPEDYREVIAAYLRTVAKIIAESDGFVSRHMGDGFQFISATRRRMRTTPRAQCGPASPASTLWVASMSNPASCKHGSGSPQG